VIMSFKRPTLVKHLIVNHPHRGGTKGRNERQAIHKFLPGFGPIIGKFQVLQVLKQSDEVYDLPAGPSGFSQDERSGCMEEASKLPSNPRQDVQVP